MYRLLGGVAVIATLFAAPAFAADMAVKAPIYKAPPMAAPVYTWTGCYLGGNLGGAWTQNDFLYPPRDENEGRLNANGFVGGGQVGCDYQVAPNVLIGAQGMFDGTAIKGTDLDPNDEDEYPTTMHWFATATARVGFLATPSFLVYVKGGAAWLNEKIDYTPAGDFEDSTGNLTRSGWDAGMGLEWMFAPNWSAFVEYDHMDFGGKDVSLVEPDGTPGFVEHVTQKLDKVLVGLNWRLNWMAAR